MKADTTEQNHDYKNTRLESQWYPKPQMRAFFWNSSSFHRKWVYKATRTCLVLHKCRRDRGRGQALHSPAGFEAGAGPPRLLWDSPTPVRHQATVSLCAFHTHTQTLASHWAGVVKWHSVMQPDVGVAAEDLTLWGHWFKPAGDKTIFFHLLLVLSWLIHHLLLWSLRPVPTGSHKSRGVISEKSRF